MPLSPAALAERLDALAGTGVHNLNLVTAGHFLPAVVQALTLRRNRLPVVWNSSGYESIAQLRALEDVVDVYLPDFKYADAALARRLSGAADYPETALAALREMLRQKGNLMLDDDGLATRGVLVRHLVLPGQVENSLAVLRTLADAFGEGLALSLMAQYVPPPELALPAPFDRGVTAEAYEQICDEGSRLGFYRGYTQDLSAGAARFTPDFDGTGCL